MIDGNEKMNSTATVTCDAADCGLEIDVPAQYEKGAPVTGQVQRRLLKSGWSLVKGNLHCPDCTAARAADTGKPKESTPVTNATEKTDVRRPDLGMRRQILDMLHAAYDVQGQRYSGSETDKTVAEAVGSGCLFGWVAEIREEFFGPSGGNAEMDDLRKALAENAKRLDEINRRATKALADVREEIGALSKMAAEAQKETERLTKRLDSVRHAVGPKAGVRV